VTGRARARRIGAAALVAALAWAVAASASGAEDAAPSQPPAPGARGAAPAEAALPSPARAAEPPAGSALPPEGEPAADCARDAAALVQDRYESLRALRARFTQITHHAAFGAQPGPEATPARGRAEFAKPGRMRFEYEAPEPSVVVSDGKTLWIYDPGAKEVQVLGVERGFLSAAAIQFLLGEGKLLETFEVRAAACGAERVQLELYPRSEASYERLELWVDPASGWIRETEVHDLLGNRTHVAFVELEAIAPPPDERFRFDPPPGVRVLTLEEEPQ
jgi:outer membrane lipoprotein carrier protein